MIRLNGRILATGERRRVGSGVGLHSVGRLPASGFAASSIQNPDPLLLPRGLGQRSSCSVRSARRLWSYSARIECKALVVLLRSALVVLSLIHI